MNLPDGMQVVFRGKTEYMREIAQQLTDAGIRSVSGALPGGAWGTYAWLAVASTDTARAIATHEQHLDHMLAREGLPQQNHAADLDAEETSCPACQTVFRTAGVTRCPECGLNFAG